MLTPDEIRELDEHWSDFRALQDRCDRLASLDILAITVADAEELIEVQAEVAEWEAVLSGELR